MDYEWIQLVISCKSHDEANGGFERERKGGGD